MFFNFTFAENLMRKCYDIAYCLSVLLLGCFRSKIMPFLILRLGGKHARNLLLVPTGLHLYHNCCQNVMWIAREI
uniref:Uncharacterized protein n=1 Tax=Arundo donax TaxID=35708 RepID=A0A0A9HNL3_ARUDO